MTPLDAYDLLKFAAHYEAKLKAACDALSAKRKLEREKAWLQSAYEALAAELSGANELLSRARELADLAPVRAEHAGVLQGEWVDTLEKLVAGITFHAGSRAPLIETLFPHVKFPALRKPNRAVAETFAADFDKRLKLSYVTRILAQDDFQFAKPVLDQVAAAWSKYQSSFADGGLPEEEAAPLRQELLSFGKRAELVLQQVRFIAEAALLPVKNAFEEAGLQAKPKKRAGKVDVAALEAALTGETTTPASASEGPEAQAVVSEAAGEVPSVADGNIAELAAEAPPSVSAAKKARKQKGQVEDSLTKADELSPAEAVANEAAEAADAAHAAVSGDALAQGGAAANASAGGVEVAAEDTAPPSKKPRKKKEKAADPAMTGSQPPAPPEV